MKTKRILFTILTLLIVMLCSVPAFADAKIDTETIEQNSEIKTSHPLNSMIDKAVSLINTTMTSYIENLDVETPEPYIEVPAYTWQDDLSNKENLFYYMTVNYGYSTATAAGLLANTEAESEYSCFGSGDGGTSYGLFCWHAGFYKQLRNWCSDNGYDYRYTEGQLAFLDWTLKNEYTKVGNYINSVTDGRNGASNAAYYFCKHYERPANTERSSERRAENAKTIYDEVSQYESWDEIYTTGKLEELSQNEEFMNNLALKNLVYKTKVLMQMAESLKTKTAY